MIKKFDNYTVIPKFTKEQTEYFVSYRSQKFRKRSRYLLSTYYQMKKHLSRYVFDGKLCIFFADCYLDLLIYETNSINLKKDIAYLENNFYGIIFFTI